MLGMVRARVSDRLFSGGLGRVATAMVCAVGLAACDGGEPDVRGEPRIDSADRFKGERGQVARTLEAFERAVLAGDVERICRQLLSVRESRDPDNDNGGHRFCISDRANDPDRELQRAGQEARYDLVVRRVDLEPRRRSRASRRATARVKVGSRIETFLLAEDGGRWEIRARRLSAFRRRGHQDFLPRCRDHALISVFASPAKNARTPREALTRGPFGDAIVRAVSRGASLSLASVSYAPDYVHTYLLRDPRGNLRRAYPVTVYRSGSFDASDAVICEGREAQRIADTRRIGFRGGFPPLLGQGRPGRDP